MCMSTTSLVFWRWLVCWCGVSHQGILLFTQSWSSFCPGNQDHQRGECISFPIELSEYFCLWKTTQICQKGPSHWQKPGKTKPVGDWNKSFYYILIKSKLAHFFWPKEKPLVILGLFKFIKCWRHSHICKGQWIPSVSRSRVTPARRLTPKSVTRFSWVCSSLAKLAPYHFLPYNISKAESIQKNK